MLLLIAGTSAFTQNHYLGIRAGSNFSNSSTNSAFFDDFNSRTGLLAGITYEYSFLKMFRFGADLLYDQRGQKMTSTLTNEIGEPIGEGDVQYIYDYLSIPVKAGISLGNRLFFFANIGLVPAFNISARVKYPTDVQGQMEDDISNRVESFDLAGMAEAGAGLNFLSRFKAFVAVSYTHSFNDFNKGDYFFGAEMRHYSISVNGGISYALKK